MKTLTTQQFINMLDSNFGTIEKSDIVSDSGVKVNGDDLFEFMYEEIDSNEKTVAEVFQVENVSGYINSLGAL